MAYRRRNDQKPLPKSDQVIARKSKLAVDQLLVSGRAAYILPCACCKRPVVLPFLPVRAKVCEECMEPFDAGACLTVRGMAGSPGYRVDTRANHERGLHE